MLSLLYRDFDFSNGFHIDHVYPKSKMTERRLVQQGVSQVDAKEWSEMRDDLANLQLLQGGPNKSKSNSDFDDWLQEQFPSSTKRGYFLMMHHFPDWGLFPYSRFGEFIEERQKIIIGKLEQELA